MALQISSYVDPGVYIGEVVVPGAVNIATTPVQLGIIGPGDRLKYITNEAVQRGLVEQEALTLVNQTGSIASISAPVSGVQTLTDSAANFPASIIGQTISISNATSGLNNGTFTIVDRPSATTVNYTNPAGVLQAGAAGSYTISLHATLAKRSDRRLQNTTVFKNGFVVGDNFLAYQSAYLQGDVTANRTFASPGDDSMVLTLDGKTPIVIRFTNNGSGAITVTQVGGVQFNVAFGTSAADTSIASVAAAINAVLTSAGATALGYGGSYASAARSVTAGIRIQSPVSSPSSDVQVLAPITGELNDAAGARLFTTYTAAGLKAASILGVSRLVYASTATFLVDYVDLDSNADTVNNSGVQTLLKVGSFAGVGNFELNIDYRLTGNTIDWGGVGQPPDTAPLYPPTGQAGPIENFAVGANDTLRLSFDGRAAIDIDLIQVAPPNPILGFTYGLASPLTAAQVAGNINAIVANSATYGPRYNAVATVVNLGGGNFIQLTSPTEGEAGSVQILVPSANSANTVIFGLSATQTISVTGSGSRPALGALYFASYTITRPASDYNVQKRFFTLDSARADLGPTTAQNPLMIACEIAFANGVPSVVVVQVNDSSSPGTPTRAEYLAALNATTNTDVVTDVVVLTTDLAVQTDLKDHVENQSSPTEKHYRRGWFGMARNTNVGDKDTADTYVFRARRTLQVAADSPGRGRYILVAPPQLSGVSRDITLEDGSTQTVNLDSTYLAVALAAKKSSVTSPATSLARKTVTGFNIADITTPWLKAERGLMAGQGVMVVTFEAGLFKILDPVTTEVGGGGLAAFAYESTSSQKDNITRKVNQALDANIVGIVPTDLADFMIDIKLIIAAVLGGEIGSFAIGPFRNADNTTRAIDLATDIDVQQSPNDPTKFFFKYFFNLRYPALRLFGEFSVDNPFFAPAAA